jgi:hypothetical protein
MCEAKEVGPPKQPLILRYIHTPESQNFSTPGATVLREIHKHDFGSFDCYVCSLERMTTLLIYQLFGT